MGSSAPAADELLGANSRIKQKEAKGDAQFYNSPPVSKVRMSRKIGIKKSTTGTQFVRVLCCTFKGLRI